MFNHAEQNQPNVTTGTTSTIYIPRRAESRAVKPGNNYFFVKINGAQAAFTGHIWEQVKQLIITSQVSLNHPLLGAEPMRAIRRSRSVHRDRAEQLGLNPNLINLVPATMTHVSIALEYILDKKNRLADLTGLINDDAFIAAVSLTPGAAMVARTIGSLSQKLIQTFFEPEERQPILQFAGDFNIPAADLQDGYYAILGTRDAKNPLPNPLPALSVADGRLLADGRPITQLSYVIMEVRVLDARTRELNEGAPWAIKLRQAEATAERLAGDPFAAEPEQNKAWDDCKILLKEAQLLLLADTNYLPREASNIIKAAFAHCHEQIFEEAARGFESTVTGRDVLDEQQDRAFLDIPAEENLEETLAHYADQVIAARKAMAEADIQ